MFMHFSFISTVHTKPWINLIYISYSRSLISEMNKIPVHHNSCWTQSVTFLIYILIPVRSTLCLISHILLHMPFFLPLHILFFQFCSLEYAQKFYIDHICLFSFQSFCPSSFLPATKRSPQTVIKVFSPEVHIIPVNSLIRLLLSHHFFWICSASSFANHRFLRFLFALHSIWFLVSLEWCVVFFSPSRTQNNQSFTKGLHKLCNKIHPLNCPDKQRSLDWWLCWAGF